jgi:hypothetical protein
VATISQKARHLIDDMIRGSGLNSMRCNIFYRRAEFSLDCFREDGNFSEYFYKQIKAGISEEGIGWDISWQ